VDVGLLPGFPPQPMDASAKQNSITTISTIHNVFFNT
jgi:hypothetical protein